ncbi:hypothetical protein EB796_010419 [Bugula neritina]|uniref:Uncharacterized protein n=1 Tax=Bugula neritina TaxID=10212 RepID=A0A7J7JXZ4_BUGNE|nr:hypothetical protein EB796_010419 [Bugula neritina]
MIWSRLHVPIFKFIQSFMSLCEAGGFGGHNIWYNLRKLHFPAIVTFLFSFRDLYNLDLHRIVYIELLPPDNLSAYPASS